MWPLVAALISSIVGFGAGLIGVSTPSNLTPSSTVSPTPYYRACYHPQTDQKITLRWPDDFINVPDNRSTLNPGKFSSLPKTFNSTGDPNGNGIPDCKELVLNSQTTDSVKPVVERSYILVRTNVRISSCKTDELAGPYGSGFCPHSDTESVTTIRHRGSCNLNDYTDLRKVAETLVNGEPREIFWNPYSYNVGCNYEQDNNCGPSDREKINLKDFIYVLKKRDAFTPADNAGCPVLWDAGSTNEEACSHYFDVYLAEDFHNEAKNAPPTSDPDNPYFFLKNIVENCQEQSHYTPVPDSILWIPPSFIRHPFLPASQGLSPLPDKLNPETSLERTNYNYYIWSNPQIFKPDVTNLIKLTETKTPLNLCIPNSPKNECYDPIGSITFRDEDGKAETFKVYSKISAPQTFVLVKTTDTTTSHIYMITDKDLPAAEARHDPTLQLKSMELISQNQWTWATPWCKPAIYFYPEKPTELTVKLSLDGQLTKSIPSYNEKKGWQIKAYPDGHLNLQNSGLSYPYLFYEADIKEVDIPKEGWVVEKSKVKNQVSKIMKRIGFNEKETVDFLHYWLPKLNKKPYYFITLISPDEINQKEKLQFSVNPDTLIRTRIVFEGLNAPFSVTPPDFIKTFERIGFTVTDWGATIIGHSCSDISVK